MKSTFFLALISVASLAGFPSDESAISDPPSAVGADRDEHGCVGSAGYKWCARRGECERPWELAEEAGFENTPSNFEKYCGE
jgi:hypothetical protein